MATRSTISLKVADSDKGMVFHFDEDKLPYNLTCENGHNEKVGDVIIKKDYLTIYHHWDGYPEGVGKTLLNKFNDHDSVLNLLCGGDMYSINGEQIIQECTWIDKEWKDVQPKQSDTEPSVTEEFAYLFKDGKWYYKVYDYPGWIDLKEYLETIKEED